MRSSHPVASITVAPAGSLLLALLCASCAPAIFSFHAAPNRICSGDRVTFDWSASKSGTISATPEQPTPGEVAAKGSASIVPTASARYHLEVRNLWGSAARDNDVEVLAGRSLAIGNSIADPAHPPSCSDRTLSVVALAPSSAWSSHAVVADVTTLAEDRHRYHIEHAGVRLDLAPGETSSAFKGKPVAGEWALSLTLLEGEVCQTPALPLNLGIQLVAACGKETP